MTLPKDNPTNFCKAFIQREIEDFKKKPMWMSYWSVMSRMIERADELKLPFEELIEEFGYSDKFEGIPPENSYIWLTLEHMWASADFNKADVSKIRDEYKELLLLQEDIVDLASRLSCKLRRQNELFEYSGFQRQEYQCIDDMIELASEENYLYKSHVSPKLNALAGQYDLKYWPSRADVVESIACFEEAQPEPHHSELPETVIDGREPNIKDFVLAFDRKFDDMNGLLSGFRFGNNAMADIINVVLDLPVDKLATGEAVRVVRNRFKDT